MNKNCSYTKLFTGSEWNLIPVDKNINSSKNNKLPSWQYFDNFVNLQKKGFEAAHSFKKCDTYLQNYIIDLELQNWKTIKIEELKTKYENIYTPLFSIAEQQGFEADWIYRT